ncbi:MAG: hypothetical protein Q8M47_02370 [Devosia sp.]|nr:hypothetical protein [Devosia sp.]
MAKVRYYLVPRERHWTLRCARRRIGVFADHAQAVGAAMAVVSVAQVRGRPIEVLEQDPDGRWREVAPARQRLSSSEAVLIV